MALCKDVWFSEIKHQQIWNKILINSYCWQVYFHGPLAVALPLSPLSPSQHTFEDSLMLDVSSWIVSKNLTPASI